MLDFLPERESYATYSEGK